MTLLGTSVQFGAQERKKDGEARVCILKGFVFELSHCFFSQVFLSEAVRKEGDSAFYSLWVK